MDGGNNEDNDNDSDGDIDMKDNDNDSNTDDDVDSDNDENGNNNNRNVLNKSRYYSKSGDFLIQDDKLKRIIKISQNVGDRKKYNIIAGDDNDNDGYLKREKYHINDVNIMKNDEIIFNEARWIVKNITDNKQIEIESVNHPLSVVVVEPDEITVQLNVRKRLVIITSKSISNLLSKSKLNENNLYFSISSSKSIKKKKYKSILEPNTCSITFDNLRKINYRTNSNPKNQRALRGLQSRTGISNGNLTTLNIARKNLIKTDPEYKRYKPHLDKNFSLPNFTSGSTNNKIAKKTCEEIPGFPLADLLDENNLPEVKCKPVGWIYEYKAALEYYINRCINKYHKDGIFFPEMEQRVRNENGRNKVQFLLKGWSGDGYNGSKRVNIANLPKSHVNFVQQCPMFIKGENLKPSHLMNWAWAAGPESCWFLEPIFSYASENISELLQYVYFRDSFILFNSFIQKSSPNHSEKIRMELS